MAKARNRAETVAQAEESEGVKGREGKSLTVRERAFIRAYVAGETQGRALPSARAAGFGPADTGAGSKLLGRPHVKAEIIRQLVEQDITAARVLTELSRVAYSDMRDYAEWGPDGVTLKPSTELSDLVAGAVAEVSETTTKDGGSLRFKLHDKLGALNTLAKYLRLLGEEDTGGKHVYLHFYTNVDFEKMRQPAGQGPGAMLARHP